MKYLFFDCESIHIKHKYSYTFGYVLTDDNFKIIEEDDIVFNPDIKKNEYDWRVVRSIMNYNLNYLNKLNNFKRFYTRIKRLMSNGDVLCIGFETEEDVKYILNDCLRYNLPAINFKYVDLRKIILFLTKEKSKSLAFEFMRYCNDNPYGAHNSQQDSYMTMSILKKVLKIHKKTFNDILKEKKDLIGTSMDFKYGYEDLKDIRSVLEKKNIGLFRKDKRIVF